ncbi:hypothetical protein C7U92_27880 [Bradyrhizobium sp. WBOS7]|nr:hypothetical protein [Bradyrhizobium sp. WBOS2]MDD1574477.1 hypothetical protein [Bradyrhizobium sp. WBOS1]MDD1580513.1 hypothetical protein [Bradyrhizobium sp. WBOS7]MDD1604198.1 hypothetical protein [Bradyrhizobium sp. WBOS16]
MLVSTSFEVARGSLASSNEIASGAADEEACEYRLSDATRGGSMRARLVLRDARFAGSSG